MKKTLRAALLIFSLLLTGAFLASCSISGRGDGTKGPDAAKSPEPKTKAPETKAPADPKEEYISRLVSNMTIRDKAAQLILARYPGEGGEELLKEYGLGGYILFSENFKDKSKEEVLNMMASLNQAVEIPLFMAVDEEGGSVVRVSQNKNLSEKRFLSPSALLKKGGFDAAYGDAVEKGKLLLSLGVNMNLAPVADVCEDKGSFMYSRAAQLDAAGTAKYVKEVVSGMREAGIIGALKHFPGYGSTADTHYAIAYDKRPYASFLESDFLPFIAGIEAGGNDVCVLVSHNMVPAIDGENPSSLSPKVNAVLRNDLGFDGVVMTDDLDMGAIKEFLKKSGKSPAVQALLAGNDLLILGDVKKAVDEMESAVGSGELSTQRIDEALRRVLALKIDMGILKIE